MQTRFSGWRIAAFATIVLGLTGPGQTIGVSVFIDHFADDLELSKNAIAGGYAIGTLTGSLMMPSVGSWVDRYGVRRSMTVIAVLFSLALVGRLPVVDAAVFLGRKDAFWPSRAFIVAFSVEPAMSSSTGG